MSVSLETNEQAVLKAVEDFAWDRHSTLTASDIEEWNLDEEDHAKLQWDGQGYLLIIVEDVKIETIEIEYGLKVWYVAATINTGLDGGDSDVYSCYQGEDGKYVVAWDHS